MFFRETNIFVTGGRSHYRIPSIVAANDGTVIAFCNDRKDTVIDHADESALVCCRKKPGEDWGSVVSLAELAGWTNSIGAAVYDRETDTVFCCGSRSAVSRNEFGDYTKEDLERMRLEAEEKARAAGVRPGAYWMVSRDSGATWTEMPYACTPYAMPCPDGAVRDLVGSCHGSAPGIQLHTGRHKGRLLCPARFATGTYTGLAGLQIHCYNCAVYSDDHGQTWHTTAPVQQGTGEGTLLQKGDGTIYYNSRAYFQDQKRYLAESTDGGETWGNYHTDNFLLEEKNIGCNASLLRTARAELNDSALLPEGAESVTMFINPRDTGRRNLTACISFDEGETWAHTRQIREHLAAYSALTYNRADGHFYLLFEHGEKDPYDGGLSVAELDLEWLLSR